MDTMKRKTESRGSLSRGGPGGRNAPVWDSGPGNYGGGYGAGGYGNQGGCMLNLHQINLVNYNMLFISRW